MHFALTLRYFQDNNDCNIAYMAALIFLKNLDLQDAPQRHLLRGA
jgi:hypothetical protein